MGEAGQALLLVRLEHVDPSGGPGPEDAHHDDHDDCCDHGEMPPRHSGDEEHRAERREVDERGAEVGLSEDEHHRHEGEPDHPQRRVPAAECALPLGQHSRKGEDEQELSELRRLEGEEAEADPTRRPVRGVADQQHERDHHGGTDEDSPPVAPVEIRIDERCGDQHDSSDARVEDLAVEVVAGIARNGELRDAGDAPEPDDDECCDAQEQDPVQRADDGEQAWSLAFGAQSRPL